MLGIRPDYLALGDLDNDGDLDLLSANASSSNTVGVHLNQGTALLVTSVAPVRNARAVVRTTPVAVTFNQDLSMAPATQSALKLFSQQAGGCCPARRWCGATP